VKFQNIELHDDIGLIYTAGSGINFWAMRLDPAGAMASEIFYYYGDEMPRAAGVALALSVDF